MIRTQIQLPDRLHKRLKALAEREETSLAEIVRTAGEYMLRLHPEIDRADADWTPPEPGRLGIRADVPVSGWRELANEPAGYDPRRRRPAR